MLREIAARLSESLEDDDAAMLRVVLAIFCKVHPDELKAPLSALAHRWYEIAGPHLEWQAIGANASRLSRAHSDTLNRIEQEIDVARGDQMMSFLLQGVEAFAPEFRLKSLVTDHVDNPDQKWTTLTEIVLPIPSDDASWEALVQLADDICGRFPYDSAYMSPAFLCGDESLEHEAGIAIAPLAMRHHGLDVADNATTCYFLGRMTRGARWLTFLSNDLAGKGPRVNKSIGFSGLMFDPWIDAAPQL